MVSAACLVIGAVFCGATGVMMGFEETKGKKKKNSDGISPKGKTMCCAIMAFMMGSGGVCSFLFMLDRTLKEFKDTAYYPYAMSHAGPYIGGFGSFITFWCMMMSINRVTPFCGKKEP